MKDVYFEVESRSTFKIQDLRSAGICNARFFCKQYQIQICKLAFLAGLLDSAELISKLFLSRLMSGLLCDVIRVT